MIADKDGIDGGPLRAKSMRSKFPTIPCIVETLSEVI